MILTEWNTEDAIAFAREEGKEDGLAEGKLEGRIEGRIEGRTEEKYEIARNLLAKGSTPEFVQEVTRLSQDEIAKL